MIFSDISEECLDDCRSIAGDQAGYRVLSATDLGDVEADVVTTRSVLIYVSDKRRAFSEFFRVLRPGGRLVAATNGQRHLEELWSLVDRDKRDERRHFFSEDAGGLLRRHFASVRRIDIEDPVTFVNAPALAAERGVQADISTATESPTHRSVVDVRAVYADGSVANVSGTLTEPQLVEKIVQINGRNFDLRAEGVNLIVNYIDRPGTLGKIGNCQIGVSINAAGERASCPLDWRLFLRLVVPGVIGGVTVRPVFQRDSFAGPFAGSSRSSPAEDA